ncbi:MAG TPA: thioredoxin [Bacteroidales bacterium]|nr:thioredoxin [Bacteroidales bacterium]
MKNLSVIFFALLASSCSGQPTINKIISDKSSGKEILYGLCNREGLTAGNFAVWFNSEYNLYEPEQGILADIQPELFADIQIKVFLGTWCGDSRREVPRFYKVLDKVGFDESALEIICLDTSKKAEGFDTEKMNILRVPTFVIFRNEVEIGRIIETPKTTLETDFYHILMGI